jgi:hypothetical protein
VALQPRQSERYWFYPQASRRPKPRKEWQTPATRRPRPWTPPPSRWWHHWRVSLPEQAGMRPARIWARTPTPAVTVRPAPPRLPVLPLLSLLPSALQPFCRSLPSPRRPAPRRRLQPQPRLRQFQLPAPLLPALRLSAPRLPALRRQPALRPPLPLAPPPRRPEPLLLLSRPSQHRRPRESRLQELRRLVPLTCKPPAGRKRQRLRRAARPPSAAPADPVPWTCRTQAMASPELKQLQALHPARQRPPGREPMCRIMRYPRPVRDGSLPTAEALKPAACGATRS